MTTDDNLQNDYADKPDKSTPTLSERSEGCPPTNISVKNIKDQIVNMSAKANTGFKDEYNVSQFLYKVSPVLCHINETIDG